MKWLTTIGKREAQVEQVPSIASSRGPTHAWRRQLIRWSPRSIGILVLILLAFFGVDFGAGLRSLGHARPEIVALAMGVFCLGVLGRMATWVLLASSLKLGYQRAISYVRVFLVSWFAGLGIPRGAASLTRLAVIAADKRSVGRGMVAVGVEQAMQAATIVILLLFSSIYLSAFSIDGLRWLLLGVGVLAAGTLLLTLAARLRPIRSLRRRLGSHRRVRSFMDETKGAVTEARHMPPHRLAGILGVALVAALLTVTALFISSRALDLHINFVVLMAAWAAVGLTGLLPISINGLGPREGILTAAVAGAGLNSEGGIALGLLWFFMQAATRLIAGLTYFTVLHANREPFRDEGQEATGP